MLVFLSLCYLAKRSPGLFIFQHLVLEATLDVVDVVDHDKLHQHTQEAAVAQEMATIALHLPLVILNLPIQVILLAVVVEEEDSEAIRAGLATSRHQFILNCQNIS